MAHQWQGVLREYADRLDVTEATPDRHARRGRHAAHPGSAALRAHRRRGLRQVRGHEPDRLLQGPRHDDGDLEGRRARREGRHLRLDRQHVAPRPPRTPRTPASPPRCSCPRARSPWASSARPSRTTASCCRSRATSTTASTSPATWRRNYPVHLVNSVNNDRIEGQKTAAFEVVDVLGDAPDFHFLPVGNAGNYTAYSRGYREDVAAGRAPSCPACSGSRPPARRPIVARRGRQAPRDHRVGDPHRQPRLVAVRPRGPRARPTATSAPSPTRPSSPRSSILSAEVGVFVEPASAIGVAGLLERADAGVVPEGREGRHHGHGPRPEGPAVGPPHGRRRRGQPDRASPSRHRARSPSVLGLVRDAWHEPAARPGRSRAVGRRCASGCRPRRRTSAPGSTRSASPSRSTTRSWSRRRRRTRRDGHVEGVGAGEVATDDDEPRRPRGRRGLEQAGPPAARTRLRARTRSRTAAASVRPPRRSSSGMMAAKGLLEGVVDLDASTCCAWPPRWRATPTTSRPPSSAA